jgi:hypothetical protein
MDDALHAGRFARSAPSQGVSKSSLDRAPCRVSLQLDPDALKAPLSSIVGLHSMDIPLHETELRKSYGQHRADDRRDHR